MTRPTERRLYPNCTPALMLAVLSDQPCKVMDLIELVDAEARWDAATLTWALGSLVRRGMARNLRPGMGRHGGLYVITEYGEREREHLGRSG